MTIKEEEAFVAICNKYARRDAALSIPDFIELANRYKGKTGTGGFSRHFVSGFIDRHKKLLCIRMEKLTLPTRSSDMLLQEAGGFIAKLDPLFMTNATNKRISVFFFKNCHW